MSKNQHKPASAEMAWRNGAAAGEPAKALLWLERAVRIAPDDPRIALDLANIRLGIGGPEQIALAAAAFEVLAARYDVAAAWLGIIAARRLAGQHAAAGEALRVFLSRHCVPEDWGFSELALSVAKDAGWPGYCGIDADAKLHRVAGAANLCCYLDGVKLPLRHLDKLPETGKIRVWAGAFELLGSPLNPATMRRVEGMVEANNGGLSGWASRPAAPAEMPELSLIDAKGQRRPIALGAKLPADDAAPLTARWGFECKAAMLAGLTPPFRVSGPNDEDILGSPLDPRAVPAAAPLPATPNTAVPDRASLAVVVPVYAGLTATQACLTALPAALPVGATLIIVDDASPDPQLADWLGDFARNTGAYLIRHARNRGFPAAAQAGMIAAGKRDVLLLNSDTLVPPGAIHALIDAVYSHPDIGSATPFSNEAAILSYPHSTGGNAAPDLAGTIALHALAAAANGSKIVEIPTGIGFCMLMRHDCIAATGRLRTDLFAQGYGEENDWCQRAKLRGFRHVAAAGAYVAHQSGVSFGAAGQALNMRNGRLLERLHPGYVEMIGKFIAADPLAPARRNFDALRFASGRKDQAVLLISHHHGGGVRRRVEVEMRRLRAAGKRPILIHPSETQRKSRYPRPAQLTDDAPGDYPNLHFMMPRDADALLGLLRAENIGHAMLHHGLGHHAMLRGIAAQLGCPLDIVVHDYASFCPRVHLVGPANRYCGEPNLSGCAACVTQAGDETKERLGIERLLARSAQEFAGARRITAPSADAAARIARHFPGISPEVTPWEADRLPVVLKPPRRAASRRIAVAGGIGIAKGFEIILACARDAEARNLPIEFFIAGSSSDDDKLLETKRVFITGPYLPEAAETVIRKLHADLAFIPSIWPETWCFTLSEAWRAGLYTIAFDLGAQAERIAATGRGALLPLGLPASRINDMLLRWYPETIRQKDALLF